MRSFWACQASTINDWPINWQLSCRRVPPLVTTHSSGKNLYQCDKCKKTFDQAGSLKNHKVTHSGKKGNAQCSKSFTRATDLRMHMNIHIGEKRHKCAQCINSFNQPGDLERHLLVTKCAKCLKCSGTGWILVRLSSLMTEHILELMVDHSKWCLTFFWLPLVKYKGKSAQIKILL